MMGWTCPTCSRCYAPSVTQCGSCGPNAGTSSGTVRWVGHDDCEHDIDFASTIPHCRKCNAVVTVTYTPQTIISSDSANCGHGRPSPAMCPHCIGVTQ